MKPRNWREIRDRLAGIDRAELRDRIRQELAKRQDGLLSHIGYGFARNSRNSAPIKAGNFFFRADSVDAILTLLRQRVPGQIQEIVNRAEKICRHRFDLLGYENLDCGSPIDWHLDAVHGRRAPRKLFHKVRYLDFSEVGDSKVTWELNRHQHLVTLAKACRLTGDPRYADEILRQWRQWRADNPYPVGINWASSLEVSFRSLSWIWTYHLLKGSPGLPDFRDEWLRSLALHGRHIERYLSTYFSPNTHLLGEGVGLFFLGVLCPELAAAERWKALGWEIVVREADRQVQADGFHFEQSTYYHVYALDFFLHSAVLACANNIPIPSSLEETLERMLTALCLLGWTGSPPQFGDDDGGRLFDPRRNRSEYLLDPLATGAILFHRGDYKFAAADLPEETIWLLGIEGVRRWDNLEATPTTMDSAALSAAGFHLLTAPQPATQLVVHAGPQGTQSGGHSHADALSVCLQSHGRSLLLDPGTYEYVGEGGDRDLFRSTEMHNTLRVDGANQAETATPFAWKRLTQSKVEQWMKGKGFDLVVASHDGYQRLVPPVIHRRWVLSLKNGVYLVRDVVEGQGMHQLDVSWHLGQDMQLLRENLFRVKGTSQGLALLPAQGHGWAEEVRKEDWSPVYGQKAPMTVLNFGTTATVPAEFAILLVTLEEAHRSPGSFVRIVARQPDPAVSAYRYSSEDGEYSFLFGEPGKPWRQGVVSSDAGFVCWIQKHSKILILCKGSYAAIEGGPELHCRGEVSWGEVIVEGNRRTVLSSDPEAVRNEAGASDQQPGTALRQP
ncbi:MAG: alginate lyase family protein [Candidatus Sulfotelmatobacter sp.]